MFVQNSPGGDIYNIALAVARGDNHRAEQNRADPIISINIVRLQACASVGIQPYKTAALTTHERVAAFGARAMLECALSEDASAQVIASATASATASFSSRISD